MSGCASKPFSYAYVTDPALFISDIILASMSSFRAASGFVTDFFSSCAKSPSAVFSTRPACPRC